MEGTTAFEERIEGGEVQTPSLLRSDQKDEWEGERITPHAVAQKDRRTYFDLIAAGINWRLMVEETGEGAAAFQLVALPPSGMTLDHTVNCEGEVQIT